MLFFIGVHLFGSLWFHFLLLFALFLLWLFQVLGFWVLPLRFLAVLFCLFWLVFRGRSLLAVLRLLTALSVLPFRPPLFSRFPRFWLAVGFAVPLLRFVLLRWFSLALLRAVCLLRFRSVRVLLVCRFLLRSVVAVRVLGVLLPWRLVWVALCLWLLLLVLVLRGLVLLLLRSAVLVLLPAVVRCGWLHQLVSFLCFSSVRRGGAEYWIFKDCFSFFAPFFIGLLKVP